MAALAELIYAGVPNDHPRLNEQGSAVSCCAVALARPKSMIRGSGFPSTSPTKNVGWLQIAMDDGFSVGMLHAFADVHEKLAQSHLVICAA